MKLDSLYKEEKTTHEALKMFETLSSKIDIFQNVQRQPFFNDEPKLYDFSTAYCSLDKNSKKITDFGGGIDQNKEKALLKSVGEAVERYCISIPQKNVLSSVNNLKPKAINLDNFVDFTNKQLKNINFHKFTRNKNTKFWWTTGYSLPNFEKILVPSQLTSVPYKFVKEKIIRDPITTGAALSTSLGGSIYRGICEIVERDAFMITYLNKLKRKSVDLDKSGVEIKNLNHLYSKYNLELHIIDISTDLDIPSMMGLVIDRTGIGPAISVGLSADIDPVIAAIKAAQEAIHSRPWYRKLMNVNIYNHDLNSFDGRAMYWVNPKMIKKIDFLINNQSIVLKKRTVSLSMKNKIDYVLEKLNQHKFEIFFVNKTEKIIEENGFFVTMTIIPKLVPLYLDENYKYLGNPRLKEVPKKLGYNTPDNFYSIPHPFL